jgi:hypothetical protein
MELNCDCAAYEFDAYTDKCVEVVVVVEVTVSTVL